MLNIANNLFLFFSFSLCYHTLFTPQNTDVSPHLIFKNGPHPTLWPQDVPFPGDETDTKNDITGSGGGYHDDDSQNTPDGSGGIHYPAYFKDGKGK